MAKSEFSILGLAHKLFLAGERVGFTAAHFNDLAEDESALRAFLEVREGRAEITPVMRSTVVDLDSDPFTPDGWDVREEDQLPNRMRGTFDLAGAKFDLHRSNAQKKGTVRGDKLKGQLAESENLFLGAHALDFYMKPENQHLISEEWKSLNAVYFWGTIYRDWVGRLYVRRLCWYGGAWSWDCRWLDNAWSASDPALSVASSRI